MICYVYVSPEGDPMLLPEHSCTDAALKAVEVERDKYWFKYEVATWEEAKAIFDLRTGLADPDKYGEVTKCECGGCYYRSGECWQCNKGHTN